MNDYVRRTLTYTNEQGDLQQVRDVDLLAWQQPVIVLGEPGMGKTYLLRRIADESGWTLRSAASFVAHPDPAKLISKGERIVIDGLDELSAAQESDPVYRVLGQLIKAGWPPFILSCRAADWRGAIARQDISAEYGATPRELMLEPFSRDNAIEFLVTMLALERAEQVVDYLDDKGIPDLYGNPLTLRLFGEVAVQNVDLPETRAGLMLRATEIMWSERNDRRDGSLLSDLDRDTALDAAGVASAAFILTGSEAITRMPSSRDVPFTVHATELASLPGGPHARTLVGSSRLFGAIPNAPDRYKPIHRSVAEFLGARWLARSIKDEQARDRALAMMTIDGSPPASLRGIHAWLAQDKRFAEQVIANDPYGVLRYGDADGLTIEQGRRLIRALKTLQHSNPYFRAEDWGRHSAKGLTHIELLEEVREILLASDTSVHLRTLLLGAIRGSKLAAMIADDLHGIILQDRGQKFTYAERHEAAQAAVALGPDNRDWLNVVDRLVTMGGEDATRLALDLMDDIGFEIFSPQLIARSILADLGLLEHVDTEAEHSSTGRLYGVARRLPDSLLAPLLDALAALRGGRNLEDYHARAELSDLIHCFVGRQVEYQPIEPLRLFGWLKLTFGHHGYSEEERKRVAHYLTKAHDVRRAIQYHVIFIEPDNDQLATRLWRLADVNEALSLAADDVIHFLTTLATAKRRTPRDVETWRELSAFIRRTDSHADKMLAAARPFAVGDVELEAYLVEQTKPSPKPDWVIKEEERRKHTQAQKTQAWAQHRNDFSEHENDLRRGELRWVYPASQAYLALFADIDGSLPPPDRVGQWLGHDVQAAAIAGFEAVLTRKDLPTLQQIAESYAQSRRWNFIYPMIAGVLERLSAGRSPDGVPIDLIIAVRIALQHEYLGDRIKNEALETKLDTVLRGDPAIHERYARLLIEPSLEKRLPHIVGLYSFVRTAADRALATRLAIEWLRRFPDLPLSVEIELVDALVDAGDYDGLREIGHQRAERGYVDDQRRRNWLAVALLTDFEATKAALGTIATEERNVLWHLRDRLRGGRERPVPKIGAGTLAWIIEEFRGLWPKEDRPSGVSTGNTNAWDAANFLQQLINRLESDCSDEAAILLEKLKAGPEDGYTPALRYAFEQQRSARREINFPGVTLDRLKDVVEARPPKTTDDLLVIIRHALRRLQKEVRGSDTDTVLKYWNDHDQPRDEDRCTDALIEDIMRLLPSYGIVRVPQADMPAHKIADILFMIGDAALPVECKGQWNAKLWTAATNQLDAFYLRDWRAQDRGIYLVYWFGAGVGSNFSLKMPPGGVARPTTAGELRDCLTECLPPARRGSIVIEVLDLTR
jgi:hypothetical protein